MERDVIVLEFNELTLRLVEMFVAQGHLPNFAALQRRSIVAVTDADADHPHLEPWIQWVTVHTGLSHRDHGVFDLSDGPRLKAPRIWDLASDAGKRVWVCGSMNAAISGDHINGLLLADPWASDIDCQPAGFFDSYLDLVRPYVQEYTAERAPVSRAAILRFGRFMAANGLSAATVSDLVAQLAGELRQPIKWKRAVILDRLQWDIFRRFYKRDKPALSTFFLNSTAHYQHYFWRNMEPEIFTSKSMPDVQDKYAEAILFGYRKMDRIIGECMALAGPETTIVLCTALGQRPMLDYEDIGGKQIFKIRETEAFFAFAGIENYQYAPVMAEEFHLFFKDEPAAAAAERKLQALMLDDGTPLMLVRHDGTRLFAGCALVAAPPAGATVRGAPSNRTPVFADLFYPVEAVRSGMHDPHGMLWISTPEQYHAKIERLVSLQEIAPTLLALAGVETRQHFAYGVMPEIEGVLYSLDTAA